MVAKYIALLCLLACATAKPSCPPKVTLPKLPKVSLIHIDLQVGIGYVFGMTEVVSLCTAKDILKVAGGVKIIRLVSLEIIIKVLESKRNTNHGHILILDVECGVVRYVSIEVLVDICHRKIGGYRKGVVILDATLELGTIVDLNAVISTTVWGSKDKCESTSITKEVAIGALVEVALSKTVTKPCGSCGKLICLPKIIVVEQLACKVRYPIDWVFGVGEWRRPKICSVCH